MEREIKEESMTKTEMLFEEFSERALAHELLHHTTYSIQVSPSGGQRLHASDTAELWQMFLKERIRSKPTLAEMQEARKKKEEQCEIN